VGLQQRPSSQELCRYPKASNHALPKAVILSYGVADDTRKASNRTKFRTSESVLALGSSCLLIANSSTRRFMHDSGHQMLDQVVEDDWDHDSRV
jgi:hypothetical protein